MHFFSLSTYILNKKWSYNLNGVKIWKAVLPTMAVLKIVNSDIIMSQTMSEIHTVYTIFCTYKVIMIIIIIIFI